MVAPLVWFLTVGLLATGYTPAPPAPGVAVEVDPVALPAAETAQATADDHIADATAAHAASAISGLGTAAAQNVAAFLQTANNLSDVTAATARTNLGLTSAATCTLGTAASNCVQLNGSAQLPAVSGALLTNVPAGAMPYDWADPSLGAQEEFDLDDWVDASTLQLLGTSIARDLLEGGKILRLRNGLLADGVTAVTAVRAQGALIAVPAGDWVIAIRWGYRRPAVVPTTTAFSGNQYFGPVFVDGTDLDAADWHGFHVGAINGANETASTAYTIQRTSGVVKFTTYEDFVEVSRPGGATWNTIHDVYFVRVGTDLTIHASEVGGSPHNFRTFTVSAGAGYLGIRSEIGSIGASALDIYVLAYRQMTVMPL